MFLFIGETEGPSPDEMGLSDEMGGEQQAEVGRPTEEEMEDRVTNLKFQKTKFPAQYEQTISQLEDILNGQDEENLRDQFYAGWTDEDIENLLSRANED